MSYYSWMSLNQDMWNPQVHTLDYKVLVKCYFLRRNHLEDVMLMKNYWATTR